MSLLSDLETISYILWEWRHLDGPWMCLGPNHWNQLAELHLLLQSVATLVSNVPCSLWPQFMCFKLQDPLAAHSPTELSVGGRGLPQPSMIARERWISQRLCWCVEFSQLFLNCLCLLSSCPLPAPQHLVHPTRAPLLEVFNTKSCGFERRIIQIKSFSLNWSVLLFSRLEAAFAGFRGSWGCQYWGNTFHQARCKSTELRWILSLSHAGCSFYLMSCLPAAIWLSSRKINDIFLQTDP